MRRRSKEKEGEDWKEEENEEEEGKMRKNASITITNFQNAIQVYMGVCPVCQRWNVINLSSHLIMVHDIDGGKRSHHLKKAILCRTTTSPPVQPLRTKAEKVKLKNIRPRQKRRVTQHL